MAALRMSKDETMIRSMIRIFARAGAAPGELTARRMELLRGLAEWLEIEGWTFRDAAGFEIRDGVPFEADCTVLTWISPEVRWEAFRPTDKPFSENEQWAVDLVFRNASWVSGRETMIGTADAISAVKSVRLAQVLACLAHGESRKEIASRLDISINTVAGYVREIYRIHGVKSQAMLIHKLETGAREQP